MSNDTRLCMIEGCERTKWARGYCGRHYQRFRTYGDPMFTKHPMRVLGTPDERFWAKVNAEGDCWEWMAAKDTKGYGVFNLGGTLVRAHRFAWQTLVGPIPEGLHIDHLCRNRICVCIDHLEPVTPKVNIQRGITGAVRKIRAAQTTHCPQGHEYSEENTYVRKASNARSCRKCHRDIERRRRDQRRKDTEDDSQ
jgi:hypothetical protein